MKLISHLKKTASANHSVLPAHGPVNESITSRAYHLGVTYEIRQKKHPSLILNICGNPQCSNGVCMSSSCTFFNEDLKTQYLMGNGTHSEKPIKNHFKVKISDTDFKDKEKEQFGMFKNNPKPLPRIVSTKRTNGLDDIAQPFPEVSKSTDIE